jgi:hypothetical protein
MATGSFSFFNSGSVAIVDLKLKPSSSSSSLIPNSLLPLSCPDSVAAVADVVAAAVADAAATVAPLDSVDNDFKKSAGVEYGRVSLSGCNAAAGIR